MKIQISEAEFEVMNLLWEHSQLKAAEVSKLLGDKYGWKKNTVYTYIARLIKKKYIKRVEPDFVCLPTITKVEYQNYKTNNLIEKCYNGSIFSLVDRVYQQQSISKEELDALRKLVNKEK